MKTHIDHVLDQYETGRMSRRQLVVRLGALLALAGGARPVIGAETNEPGGAGAQAGDDHLFEATGLNHIALRVTDVARSRDFYIKHLGLELSRESGNSAFLNCGKNFVALFRGDRAGLDHYCYSVKGYEVAAAEDKLRSAGLPDIRRTGGRIYFSDPDNLTVQLAAGEPLPR